MIEEQKETGKLNKQLEKELIKNRAEIASIEEELKSSEYDKDENPATYTTDELTVTRAINCMNLCMKLHQNFCENHNITL